MFRRRGGRPGGSAPGAALVVGALVVVLVGALAWLWQKTQSLNPEDHSHLDAALRELRSLDRTINQDVLRARYKLINSYEPVLASYRRVEELELVIASPPRFLDAHAQQRLAAAVRDYRASVTAKQQLDRAGQVSVGRSARAARVPAGRGDGAGPRGVRQRRPLPGRAGEQRPADGAALQPDIGRRVRAGDRPAARPAVGGRRAHRLAGDPPPPAHADHQRPALAQGQTRGRQPARARSSASRSSSTRTRSHASTTPATPPPSARRSAIAWCSTRCASRCSGSWRTACAACSTRRARWRSATSCLEERVVERTRELRAVLDNVEQALFTVDLDGPPGARAVGAAGLVVPVGAARQPAVGCRATDRSDAPRAGWSSGGSSCVTGSCRSTSRSASCPRR